jgi:carbamoylphosphate synthase large subunit
MVGHKGDALVVGPGPVTLSQGPAFQYIAARGCRLLRRRGMRVLVLEDNPATLMDKGDSGEDLFMEPAAVEVVRRIAESRRVGSIWQGLGGRRGWMLAMRLAEEGWYEDAGIIAPDTDDRTLWLCGERSLLREALEAGGIDNPAFQAVGSLREGQDAADRLGFPLVVRPHFSCGGCGAGLAFNLEDYPALLEEAMRESLTGEVLVEEALNGWRKYIAVVMRDGAGKTCVEGIFEQQELLPLHEEDAVLVYPPRRCGAEGEFALQEMLKRVVEALDLLGLVEVKLAASPGWEHLFVIDVNPRPWRIMPMLEAARGTDLLRAHLDLLTGKTLPGECLELEEKRPRGFVVVVPRPSFSGEGEGESYLSLACRSMGRGFFRGSDAGAAAAQAMEAIRGGDKDSRLASTLQSLEELMRLGGGFLNAGMERGIAERYGADPTLNMAPRDDDGLSDAFMFVGGPNDGPAGGYEANVNCLSALGSWKAEGKSAVLYTPDIGFAQLAALYADTVFVGPLQAEEIAHAADECDVKTVIVHYAGRAAKGVAAGLASEGLVVMGSPPTGAGGAIREALEKTRHAGLRVVDYSLSKGWEEGKTVLERSDYPLMATVEEAGKRTARRMIYNAEDGMVFLRDHEKGEVLWRPLREEAQEVQVEAVAWDEGHIAVLWENVDAAGIFSTDGLAVYPPLYLTSEQSRSALELAGQAIGILGWRGNLSMRMHVSNGDTIIWNISHGPAADLPFLERASALPLAEMGMRALGGKKIEARRAEAYRSSVRAPLIPYGLIAGSDILPSPQRRSTGSVMGIAGDPGMALAKALWSQGLRLKPGGKVFLSVANREKRRAIMLARELQEAGYVLMATRGTAHALDAAGIKVETVNKLREGRPNVLDFIRNGQIGLVVNVPRGKHPHSDGFYIRAAAVRHGTPCITNMEVALALAGGIRHADPPAWEISSLRVNAVPADNTGGE